MSIYSYYASVEGNEIVLNFTGALTLCDIIDK